MGAALARARAPRTASASPVCSPCAGPMGGDDGLSWNALHRGRAAVQLARRSATRSCERAPHATLAPSPFHLELLDWEAVAAWNAPWRWGPPRTPSPLPHLPSSPQELLIAYLEVVGVRSAGLLRRAGHAHRARAASPTSHWPASARTSRARKLPCADGAAAPAPADARSTSCSPTATVPSTPRAAPAGSAYQHEVLRARLDHLTGVRPPIVVDDHPRPSFAEEVFDLFNPFDPLSARSRRSSTATRGRASARTAASCPSARARSSGGSAATTSRERTVTHAHLAPARSVTLNARRRFVARRRLAARVGSSRDRASSAAVTKYRVGSLGRPATRPRDADRAAAAHGAQAGRRAGSRTLAAARCAP